MGFDKFATRLMVFLNGFFLLLGGILDLIDILFFGGVP